MHFMQVVQNIKLTALVFDFASLGVVGVLLEIHRASHVVVDPEK